MKILVRIRIHLALDFNLTLGSLLYSWRHCNNDQDVASKEPLRLKCPYGKALRGTARRICRLDNRRLSAVVRNCQV
jgi:hypothetical protein